MAFLRFLSRSFRWLTHMGYRRRFEWNRPELALGLYHFGDEGGPGYWCLKLFFVWVRIWHASYPPADPDGMFDAWGFSCKPFSERFVYLKWGYRSRFVYLPWSPEWVDTACMNARGEFVVYESTYGHKRDYTRDEIIPDQWERQSFTFGYVTKDGETQRTVATVEKVERRRWRWKLLRWLRIPVYNVAYSLDVRFSDEMGNERGSWKGGVIGCGCTYIPGEPVENALRRFELECNLTKRLCR